MPSSLTAAAVIAAGLIDCLPHQTHQALMASALRAGAPVSTRILLEEPHDPRMLASFDPSSNEIRLSQRICNTGPAATTAATAHELGHSIDLKGRKRQPFSPIALEYLEMTVDKGYVDPGAEHQADVLAGKILRSALPREALRELHHQLSPWYPLPRLRAMRIGPDQPAPRASKLETAK